MLGVVLRGQWHKGYVLFKIRLNTEKVSPMSGHSGHTDRETETAGLKALGQGHTAESGEAAELS